MSMPRRRLRAGTTERALDGESDSSISIKSGSKSLSK